MNSLAAFAIAALVAFVMFKMAAPKEDEFRVLRENYSKTSLLKGYISPKLIRAEFSDAHFEMFSKARRKSLLVIISFWAVFGALFIISYLQIQSRNDDFRDRMEEKYFSD